MAVHKADKASNNPRLQCGCCGQWKRLIGRSKDGDSFYRFFGGCGYTDGDHLCSKSADINDVCDECCQVHCKSMSEAI